jgi:hypothetical protein
MKLEVTKRDITTDTTEIQKVKRKKTKKHKKSLKPIVNDYTPTN